MARALLIVNPVAARTTPAALDRAAAALRSAGWRLEVATTAGAGDARRFAAAAVQDGCDAVAVLGGDGTTMQAAAALVRTGVPLALIPGGTGNLLAGNLRIPLHPARAAAVLTGGRARAIDLGRVMLADGEHYFGVACGAGVDARVMGETPQQSKRRYGIGAYLATTMRVMPEVHSTPCRIVIDGHEVRELPAAMVLILNCAEMIPGWLRVRRRIRPDDGILDLVVVTADTPWESLRVLLRVAAHHRLGTGFESEYLHYGRGTSFRVEPAAPLPVQFDGDPVGVTPFTAEVQPGVLTVMVPAT